MRDNKADCLECIYVNLTSEIEMEHFMGFNLAR